MSIDLFLCEKRWIRCIKVGDNLASVPCLRTPVSWTRGWSPTLPINVTKLQKQAVEVTAMDRCYDERNQLQKHPLTAGVVPAVTQSSVYIFFCIFLFYLRGLQAPTHFWSWFLFLVNSSDLETSLFNAVITQEETLDGDGGFTEITATTRSQLHLQSDTIW